MTNEETPYSEPVQPYFQVGIPGVPYSAIRAPLGTSEESMKEWATWVATCAEIIANSYAERFPSQPQDVSARPAPSQIITSSTPMRAAPVQQSNGNVQTVTRATKYEQVAGACDICGGPVGRYPKTGNMRTDKAVCLGTCKDNGKYVHTAFWLDE